MNLLNLRRLRKIYGRGEHLQDSPAAALGPRTRGRDFHSFAHPTETRRDKRPYPVDFDHADAAETIRRAMLVIANGGNMPAELLRRFQDRRPRRHGDGIAIDGECDIRHSD